MKISGAVIENPLESIGFIESSLNIKRAVLRREIERYSIFATEVYKTERCFKEDNIPDKKINKSKFINGFAGKYFFSSRYYQLKDHLNLEEYIPCSNISEIREEIIKRRIKTNKFNLLFKSYIELEDEATIYTNTPLTENELEVLAKPFRRKERVYLLYRQNMLL